MNKKAPRALVVDDNLLNSKLVSVFLKRLGWEVETRMDGLGALARLREAHFGLVLLDLRMPMMSGEQVCRVIREELGLRELPVVAYTAHGMPEERERMLAAGFSALLLKPISFQDVRQLCEPLAQHV
jgi:CheY-like chemotaxis protein